MTKKTIISALAALLILGTAGSSFAILCASDPVPAGTLLFPFLTGAYSPVSSASNPVADRTAATSLFAITNVSSSAKIVHNVLWNDFSFPLLDWDVLLTGYDVITYNFADIMEGQLIPTGGSYAPSGSQPLAQGPVPTFWTGIPSLPTPQGIGTTRNNTTTLYGLCTNPTYTQPFTVDTTLQAQKIPEFNRARVFNGLRKSQVIAENGWYGSFPPAFQTPTWLLNRSTSDNVWAYITSDVVAGCGFGFPSFGQPYFGAYARPVTTSFYNNLSASNFRVDLGNTLIGDWFIVDLGNSAASGNPAVHIEMDNQDVLNDIDYPKQILDGASFYRYHGADCDPNPNLNFVPLCDDPGSAYTQGAEYFFGPGNTIPTNDFREPLPSAFAFRWLTNGAFDGGTKIRVWKEFTDIYPIYGTTYIYATLQYAYYAWDEEENVVTVTIEDCPVSPCDVPIPEEINQLPLEVQEVHMSEFNLPTDEMTFGWTLFAFLGSNTLTIGIPGGYIGPSPNTFGTQAWIEVFYEASGLYSVDFNAAVMGNFLCDGLGVQPEPFGSFWGATDLGDVLY